MDYSINGEKVLHLVAIIGSNINRNLSFKDTRSLIDKLLSNGYVFESITEEERQVVKSILLYYVQDADTTERLNRAEMFKNYYRIGVSKLGQSKVDAMIIRLKEQHISGRKFLQLFISRVSAAVDTAIEQESMRIRMKNMQMRQSQFAPKITTTNAGEAVVGTQNISDTNRLTQSDKQLIFLSQAYYKADKFAEQNGCSGSLSRTITESTIKELLSSGKVDSTAVRKFNERILPYIISNGLTRLSMDKFTSEISKVIIGEKPGVDSSEMKKQFMQWFKNCNIRVTEEQATVIYSGVLYSLGDAFCSDAFKNMAKNEIKSLGINGARFESSPQIIISSDGCSHNTWGSLIGHYDKRNKYN